MNTISFISYPERNPIGQYMSDGILFKLKENTEYEYEYYGIHRKITVEENFITDFASVPAMFTLLVPRTGEYILATILHDWLYSMGSISFETMTRYEADRIFKEFLKMLGVPKWKTYLIFYAVRLFGSRYYIRIERDK